MCWLAAHHAQALGCAWTQSWPQQQGSSASAQAAGALPADLIAVGDKGVLALGPLEIARCDNDPNFPENGRIKLSMRGGR